MTEEIMAPVRDARLCFVLHAVACGADYIALQFVKQPDPRVPGYLLASATAGVAFAFLLRMRSLIFRGIIVMGSIAVSLAWLPVAVLGSLFGLLGLAAAGGDPLILLALPGILFPFLTVLLASINVVALVIKQHRARSPHND